ncbi:HtaA domain-containing protein [Streptomyces sp. NPDC050548]|uniref:HtaA domain-containing protein n=1 Tax=Streptomyces sp. NPDC050548 TaxID=3365629 RepID=UPI0037880CE6
MKTSPGGPSWTLSAGAEDGGALFRFPDGEGTYKNGELTASFKGAVRFTGAQGLDLRISGVRATVKAGKGTLYADVAGADSDFTGKKVPLVTFTARNLKAVKGLAKLTEAPAKLTAQGAKAFGGMYQAGTAMDPVSLAVALTDDAKLPALPDLGTAPTVTGTPEEPSAKPSDSAEPVADNSTSGSGSSTALPITLGAGALLLVAAVSALVVVRRRRTRPATGSASPEAE